MEGGCLPLLFVFLSRTDWSVLGWGTNWTQLCPPLGPSALSPAPSGGEAAAALSPHPPLPIVYVISPHIMGICSLTFPMTPTTLQPLSCSRAELSVRMGRSLRLLKPCGGRRQAVQAQGPAPQPLPCHPAAGRPQPAGLWYSGPYLPGTRWVEKLALAGRAHTDPGSHAVLPQHHPPDFQQGPGILGASETPSQKPHPQ